MSTTDVPLSRVRRWTRAEVYRLLELGILNDEREEHLELLDGLLVNKVRPMTPRHAATVGMTRQTLEAALPLGVCVWTVCPLAIDDFNEPEPDVLVVVGGIKDYTAEHPRPADTRLLVEVADDTLDFDRGVKARAYARAGVADFWIVNIVDRQLEIYRDPTPDDVYQDVQIYEPKDTVGPLALPDAEISVAALLPPAP